MTVMLQISLPGVAGEPPELWVDNTLQHQLLTVSAKAKQVLTSGSPGEGTPWCPHQLWELCSMLGTYLVSAGEWGPVLPSHPWSILYPSPLSPSFHSPHEFLWSLLREEAGNFNIQRRVGVELISVGESNCQSTDFSKKLFLFPNGKLPFLECSGDAVSWNPQTSLLSWWY